MAEAQLIRVGGRELKVSNLGKVLYPSGFTKGDVVDYYRSVSAVLLPHLKDRPITLKRYPDGVEKMFFYEKRCPSHKPEWVKTAHVWSESNDDYVDYCLINDEAALVWVANLAAIELHVLMARAKAIARPTTMVFDLDPGPGVTQRDSARIAVRMRELLGDLKLECFPKTSGGKGIHLYVPLNTAVTFEQTKSFARLIAMKMEKDDPAGVTSNMRKDLRGGRVFIDWSQNDDHKTTACVYTLRAREVESVSTPLTWKEVEGMSKRRGNKPVVFLAGDVVKRVGKMGDLFGSILMMKQKLPKLG